MHWNLLFKWFCGYPIFAAGPDHSTLHLFEVYLMREHPRLYFDTVLRQIDEVFPQDRQRTQIGDTFALHADAALESLIRRLRHSHDRLLVVLEAVTPAVYEAVAPQLDTHALLGDEAEKADYFLSPAEWQQRLRLTAIASRHCLDLLAQQAIDHAGVQKWVGVVEKILADELELTLNEQGEVTQVRKLGEKERGSYRICSATDPEATIRNHGPGKEDFGYNISVAATTHFIREIRADTGSQPDPVGVQSQKVGERVNKFS